MAPTKVIFIVGPTASGKSALAIDIAKKLDGEIICADSRTVYKGLDIATAKPNATEQAAIKHWGLDLMLPNERFSAADFKMYADAKIDDICSRGKQPIIVGGTGLYIDAVLFDFAFGPVADDILRQELEPLNIEQIQQIIIDRGIQMPENSKNKRYLIRAIEQGGINTKKSQPMANSVVVGLNPLKEVLYQRITDRAHAMLQNGALAEAEWLFKTYGFSAPAASAPFFKAYATHFTDNQNLDDCTAKDITLNQQLAKRQLTWFRRNQQIIWYQDANEALAYLVNCLIENKNKGKNAINRIVE